MIIKNAAFILSAAVALAVGASSHQANAATQCEINAPTPLAGRSCGTAADKATGVVRIINDGKRVTYKVKVTAGTSGASSVLLDSLGTRTKDSNRVNCAPANDPGAANASFGPELGCTLLILNSPTLMRINVD